VAAKILAIIPAHNEEDSLPGTLRELSDAQLGIDVVVIDDGSTDHTAAVVKELGYTSISLPVNLGIGGAVQTGLHYAHRYKYDIAFQYDADGQHRPDQISTLLEPIINGKADMVLGSRFLKNLGYKVEPSRAAMMWMLKKLSSIAVGHKITDNTSGFRAYGKNAIEFMIRNCSTDYPEIAAIILLARNGYRYTEVSTVMGERTAGQSMFTPLRALYFLTRSFMAIVVSVLETPVRKQKKREGE